MKRLFSWILVTVLMFTVLTACGTKSTDQTAEQTTQEAAAATTSTQATALTEAPKEPEKLSLWHIQVSKTYAPIIDAAVERFEKDNPNVTVEVVAAENDPYKTKLKVAAGSGDAPDVFHSWGGGWLEAFVKEGSVMDLTQELEKDNWRSTYHPAALSMCQFDGKNYGIAYDLSVTPVYYNKELFTKYKVEVPKTYTEFLAAVKTFKDNGIIPISIANQTKWPGALLFVYLSNRIGGEQVFQDALARKNGAGFEDPAFIEAGKKIQELVDMGAFPEGFNGMNYDTGSSRILMYSDKAAMQIQTGGFYGVVKGEAADFFKDNLGMFPFPEVEGGKGNPTNVVGGVNAFSVSSKTPHKESALKLLKYLTDQTTSQEIVDKVGKLPAVVGINPGDPGQQMLADLLSKANYLQGYYDQFLPPELGELHKDTTQAIYGKTMTPEEAAKKMEEKAKEIIK